MVFLDTQFISYEFKGVFKGEVQGKYISSIVASEFLLQLNSKPSEANYYLPYRLSFRKTASEDLSTHFPDIYHKKPYNKLLTDRIVFDFGQTYEPITQFSNLSLANAINHGKTQLFYNGISALDKRKRKVIKRRFNFLLDNKIICKTIHQDIVETGYQLLDEFLLSHNPKQNFRNTWNDILIFASAIQSSKPLITYDNELSRFITEHYAKSISTIQKQFSLVEFEEEKKPEKFRHKESKGYINRGWRVIFKR
ncbi:MAG: hypothetical protein JW866_03125 [Ignavibacteriales bacterium]|nr:hypothetical protein [Ignavibacteriales bacterium]